MTTQRRLLLFAAIAATIVAVSAWLILRARDDGARWKDLSADEMLSHVQHAIAAKGSYRVALTGHNLVLPQWGGVDSGVVHVRLDGPAANASLERTGDGLYRLVLVDGQTYFRRQSCPDFARVPGGGADVLAPFVLANLSLASRDTGRRIDDASGPPVIGVIVPKLGAAALEFDPDSYLPVRLTKVRTSADEGESKWEFSD